jgi:hypothetical protein
MTAQETRVAAWQADCANAPGSSSGPHLQLGTELFAALDVPIRLVAARDGEKFYFHTITPLIAKGVAVPPNSLGWGCLQKTALSSQKAGSRKPRQLTLLSLLLSSGQIVSFSATVEWLDSRRSGAAFTLDRISGSAIGTATVGAVAALRSGAIWGAASGGVLGLAAELFSHRRPHTIPSGTMLRIVPTEEELDPGSGPRIQAYARF